MYVAHVFFLFPPSEDTFDLLAAGAKAEMPILSPVYEAVGVSLQEGKPRVSKGMSDE